ncbi:MAG TPA: DEAD/DEAH box helicase, partial [Verrucomicrobiae bacterium]|nr:DEAD/DEAH box helicase [Verrucomicrobiae bacterium]
HLRNIENLTRRKMIRKPIPSIVEAFQGQQRIAIEKIMRVTEEEDIVKYRSAAEDLLAETDSVTLLSAALKLLTKEPKTDQISISEEAPLRVKGQRNFRNEGPRDKRGPAPKGKPRPFKGEQKSRSHPF